MPALLIRALPIIIILLGCTTPFNRHVTMREGIEQAIEQIGDPNEQRLTRLDIRAVRETPAGAVALGTYEVHRRDAVIRVMGIYRLERQDRGWLVKGTASTRFPGGEPVPPLTVLGQQAPPFAENPFLAVGGIVSDESVHQIAIILAGNRTVVPVDAGAYLALIPQRQGPMRIEALDAEGRILRTLEVEQPPASP